MTDIRGADNSVLESALELLTAQIKAAKKAMEPLALDMVALKRLEGEAGAIRKASQSNVGKESWSLAPGLTTTLRLGVVLLIEKLMKIRTSQMELGVLEPNDTERRLKEAKHLGARLSPKSAGFLDELVKGLPEGTEVTVSDGRRTVKLV